jgi:hypothetical protein
VVNLEADVDGEGATHIALVEQIQISAAIPEPPAT